MTVIVDGAIDSSQSKTLIPAYNSTYTLKFEGTGIKNIVVQLDGQIYREYTIDFSLGAVTNTVTHEYQQATTSVVTEPQTEPQTVVTQPSTEIFDPDFPMEENNYNYYD